MTTQSAISERVRLYAAGAIFLLVVFAGPARPLILGAVSQLLHGTRPAEYADLSRNELASRLKEAEAELERIRYQSVLYGLIAKENADLRSAAVASFVKSVPARILARPPQTGYDTLILDAGALSGVHENDLVAVGGVALGKIVSVTPSSSVAQLYSSAGAETDVVIGRAVAVAKGLGAGAFELLLPQNIEVAAGDPVRIPYSDTLLLGTVVSFSSRPSDSTQTVRFRSPLSLFELDFVSVIPRS
jgi:cell shape-determining protein MreC